MVKQNVGNTEDVKKFMESKNSSYYKANNDSNNKFVYKCESKVENNHYTNNEKKNKLYLY